MNMIKTLKETKPYFLYVKKHYCPNCDNKLTRSKHINYFDKHTKQAQNYNKGFLQGVYDIKVIDNVFTCDHCKKVYYLNELKQSEIKKLKMDLDKKAL